RVRVPEESLPALLEIGRARPELRKSILSVIGKRGAWLASQNLYWDYALVAGEESDEAIETTWQTGSRTARVALLQRVRARDPQRARELIASTWREDKAADRTAFLETLREGLSMADEPFL